LVGGPFHSSFEQQNERKETAIRKGLVDNSRMTRRNDRFESSHRILIAAGVEAAFIQSMTVNFRSYVVDPFELRSVERVQNNENRIS
jgi:hypothetical protein